MIEEDATELGWQPNRHSRFEVAAPRRFLLPAILLLLAEEPRHGYSLATALQALQVGRVDRPGVYRALAHLEGDGLVISSSGPRSGQGRRVYSLTAQGEHVLRRWMGVIKQERDGLDRVLRRYVATGTVDAVLAEVEGGWHSVTATPWSSVSSTSRIVRSRGSRLTAAAADGTEGAGNAHSNDSGPHDPAGDVAYPLPVGDERPAEVSRFRIVQERSVVLIDARSSVGPITFGAIGVGGAIEAAVVGRRVSSRIPPTARLELAVDHFRSGNSLYDAELMRRIDARRFPIVRLELRACTAVGSNGRFRLVGEVTFHGVSRALDGAVEVVMSSDHTMVIRGEQVIDIRDFGVVSPTVLMLRIYPDVVVKLQLEAELEVPRQAMVS